MKAAIAKHLGAGSMAWLASSSIGPRIAFAPPGDGDGDPPADPPAGDPPADPPAADPPASKLKGGLLDKRTAPADPNKPADPPADPNKPGADGRPAHVPQKFWNAKTKTVDHDGMAKAYTELERTHGELKRTKGLGADVPEKETDYFPAEGLKLEKAEKFGDTIEADDPGLKTWAKVAKKWQVGKEAAIGMARDMFAGMNEFAPAPIDMDQEFDSLGSGGKELVDGVFVWAEGMERDGKFGERDIEQVVSLSGTADGIRFLAKLRGMTGEKPIPMGLPQGARGMSQEDWHSAMREAVRAKDYKEQERLDGISAGIFGDEASSGSSINGIPNQKDVDRRVKK